MKRKPTKLPAAEMFWYLAGGVEIVTERPFRGKTEQLVYVPHNFCLRQSGGELLWTALSRLKDRDGNYSWYKIHGAPEGRAPRHVHDEAILVLEEQP